MYKKSLINLKKKRISLVSRGKSFDFHFSTENGGTLNFMYTSTATFYQKIQLVFFKRYLRHFDHTSVIILSLVLEGKQSSTFKNL